MLVSTTFYCTKVEIEPTNDIQPLDAEELVFENGYEFQRFLEFHDLKNFDNIQYRSEDPSPCSPLPSPIGYPSQQNDDYLHEERFEGMYHIVLFDHIVTRKMINIIIPETENPYVDFCNINLKLKNTSTGQKVTFKNVYNWVDENGNFIFNTNKNVYYLWGFETGTVNFPVLQIHEATGQNLNYGHDTMALKFTGITMYE